MVASPEHTIDGVGVYTPDTHTLEGDASRLEGATLEQSIKHLIVHVHNPDNLMGALDFPMVDSVTIHYHKETYSWQNLKHVLAGAKFRKLKLLTVTSEIVEGVPGHRLRTLQKMCRSLAGADLDILGYRAPAIPLLMNDIVYGGDEWYRRRTRGVYTPIRCLPWIIKDALARGPCWVLGVDCDEQFHPAILSGIDERFSALRRLELYNVMTSLSHLLTYVRGLKLPVLSEILLTSSDPEINSRGVKAIRTMRPDLRVS